MDPTSNEEQPALKTSERFCQQDSDVAFQSCDNTIFNIHRKNLETNAGAFPAQEFETKQEIVQLTETAATLELLFQFIYPQRHPDLESTEFGVLCPLAEAAEKYEVYSAINICKIRMRSYVKKHSLEVMLYAAKHGYHNIVDETAPLLLHTPMNDILINLPHHLVIPWVLYVESSNKVLQNAIAYCAGVVGGTRNWAPTTITYYDSQALHVSQLATYCVNCNFNLDIAFGQVLRRLENIRSLDYLGVVFGDVDKTCCHHTAPIFASWRSAMEEEIAAIKPFVAYL